MSAPLVMLTATAAFGVLLATSSADVQTLLSESGYGAGLILLGVVCCAIYTVWSRRITAQIEPLVMVAIQQSAGLAWAIAIWSIELFDDTTVKEMSTLSGTVVLGCIVSGLMYYAIAYWLYLEGLRILPASKAGSVLSLIPVFGITFAYVFLGERLSFSQWIGAIIILLSVISIQKWVAVPQRTALAGKDEPFG